MTCHSVHSANFGPSGARLSVWCSRAGFDFQNPLRIWQCYGDSAYVCLVVPLLGYLALLPYLFVYFICLYQRCRASNYLANR